MAFHMPVVQSLPVLRASFPEPMSRKPTSTLEEVQIQVASRFGGGRVALEAARHAISAQASLQQGRSEASVGVTLSTAAEHHNCSNSKDASRGRTGLPSTCRSPSPECDHMFRFKGHFETPNNPDLPDQEQQQAAECKQQDVTRQGLEALAHNSNSGNSDAVASAVHTASSGPAMLQGTDNVQSTAGTGSQQEDVLIPVGYGIPQRSNHVQYTTTAYQRPESEFRRSHSPEWYDARFKRYVLRSHKENVPDYRYSQAMAEGPQSPLRQSLFSFSKLHPALADKHYLRTSEENQRIHDARFRMLQQQQSPQHEQTARPSTADGGRAHSAGDRSNSSWSALKQDAEALRHQSHQVTTRAREAIAASEAASSRLRTGSGVRARPSSAPFLKGSSRLSPADQAHISDLEAQIADLQTAVEVLTHPDEQEVHSDADADAIVADILTIAHSPVFDTVHSRHARRSLADHLNKEAEDWQVPVSEEEQLRIASAAFDEHRWQEWDAATDEAMLRRALAGQARYGSREAGYASDLEEDEKKRGAQDQEHAGTDEAQSHQVGWRRTEEEWMDEYRDASSRGNRQHEHFVRPGMAPEEEALIQQAYVPILYQDLVGQPGPIGRLAKPRAARRGRHQRPFTPTSPRPMAFELRAQSRPKTIMQVKMEQDMAMRQAEEEAMRHHQFKANPLPKSTTEPRYENIRRQQAAKVREPHERSLQLLKSQERPFSFYGKALAKEEAAKQYKPPAAKDFQKPFKANPIPKSSLEERLAEISAERAAKKLAAHQAAEQKLKEAAMPPRMQLAAQRNHSPEGKLAKGRHAEKCSKRFEPEGRACGRHSPVPNFQHLHSSWENKLADCKASNRSKSTIPEDPHLGGNTAAEAEARKKHAEERRQEAVQQAALDQERGVEMRWPYVSPRGKVQHWLKEPNEGTCTLLCSMLHTCPDFC
ncbi:TPA: hypothetical protein ACH3X2_003549 [Trebouxia sp. C0005]